MTMKLLETVTVGAGGAASITFSNIPADFTDLYIVVSARTARSGFNNDQFGVNFNGVSTNQTGRELFGGGSSTSSASHTRIFGYTTATTATADTFGNASVYVPNYRSAVAKSVSIDAVTENNATSAVQNLFAGLWNSTAAITSVTLVPLSATNFTQHSTASLYGITAGSDGIVSVS